MSALGSSLEQNEVESTGRGREGGDGASKGGGNYRIFCRRLTIESTTEVFLLLSILFSPGLNFLHASRLSYERLFHSDHERSPQANSVAL